MTDLSGARVLITGAGRGLGAALAFELAKQGCLPLLAGRNVAALRTIASEIRAIYEADVPIVQIDLADPKSVSSAVEVLREDGRQIDVLVNNGAMWLEASDEDHSDGEVMSVVNSAVTGTFLLTQGVLPILQRSTRPDIVTIGSISGLPNAALQSASVPFYAAKRAQAALAEGLSQALAGTPVRSIVVHPPYLDDLTYGTSEWDTASERQKGEQATIRDVVDTVIFALTRPRHVTLSITVDADDGGIHPKPT